MRRFRLLIAALAAVLELHAQAVFKSADRGRSWTRADNGMLGDSRVNAFAATGTVLLAGTDSGVFLSSDQARSWRFAAAGRIYCLAAQGASVYAGTATGVLKSADQGRTWAATARLGKIRSLLARQGQIFAGTETSGVFRSSDEGKTWNGLRGGLPPQSQIFALAFEGDKLLAGLYAKGLYRWSEGERRWTKIGPLAPLVLASGDGAIVAGQNPGGLHVSLDQGATWSPAISNDGELPTTAPVWELAAGDQLLLAGVAKGIYFSEDRGRTWTRTTTGLPPGATGIFFLIGKSFALAGVTASK